MLHSIGGREIRQSVQGAKSFTRFMVSHKRKRSRFDIEGHSLRSSRPRCISFWFPAPPVGRRAGEMGGQSGRSKDRDGLLSLSHSPSFAPLKKRLLTQRSLCGAPLLMQGPRFHGAEESRKSLVERLRLEQKRSVLAVRYVVVAAAGYAVIELGPWGYLPTDPSSLGQELPKRGLKLVASTVGCNLLDDGSVNELVTSLPAITKLQKQLGAKFVVLLPAMFTDLFTGGLVLPRTIGDEERKRFHSNVERIGRIVTEEHGLTLAVHPHVDSHLETEADIDLLLQATDPRYVSLCLRRRSSLLRRR
jgi:hypothetical protein